MSTSPLSSTLAGGETSASPASRSMVAFGGFFISGLSCWPGPIVQPSAKVTMEIRYTQKNRIISWFLYWLRNKRFPELIRRQPFDPLKHANEMSHGMKAAIATYLMHGQRRRPKQIAGMRYPNYLHKINECPASPLFEIAAECGDTHVEQCSSIFEINTFTEAITDEMMQTVQWFLSAQFNIRGNRLMKCCTIRAVT